VASPQGEARNSNHKAVVDEDRKRKMSDKQLRDEERKHASEAREARARGKDADSEAFYAITAEQAAEVVDKQEEKRRRANSTMWDVEDRTLQLDSRLKNEVALYDSGAIAAAAGSRAEIDPLSYGTAPAYKPGEERVDALIDNLHQQAIKRATSSRRRQTYEEDEVTYINDRNKVFNQKLNREFNKYTSEIKNNLERGTAL
jgi:hypothetical protein